MVKGKKQILIIILALAVVLGIAFASQIKEFAKENWRKTLESDFDYQKAQENASESIKEGGETDKLDFPPLTLDVSKWKTYRNEKRGIEFKYPPETIVRERFNDQYDTKNIFSLDVIATDIDREPRYIFSIEGYKNEFANAREFAEKQRGNDPMFDVTFKDEIFKDKQVSTARIYKTSSEVFVIHRDMALSFIGHVDYENYFSSFNYQPYRVRELLKRDFKAKNSLLDTLSFF